MLEVARERDGDGVDREVARRQIVLDRIPQRGEVDRPPSLERNPPGAVALRERKGRAARPFRVLACGCTWIADGDVEVDDLPSEQLVADGAADNPRLLALEELACQLTHRAPRAERETGSFRSRRPARN